MAEGESRQSVTGRTVTVRHVPTGLGCFTASFLISLYYNTVLTWVLWYLLNSFQHPLPWSTCPLNLNQTGSVRDWGSSRPAFAGAPHGHPERTRLNSDSLHPSLCSLLDPGAQRHAPLGAQSHAGPSDERVSRGLLRWLN